MSALDRFAARLVGAPWAYTALVTEPPVEPAPVSEGALFTAYADTVADVRAAELDVVADLDRLTSSGLSPLEACQALWAPISEEAGDVA